MLLGWLVMATCYRRAAFRASLPRTEEIPTYIQRCHLPQPKPPRNRTPSTYLLTRIHRRQGRGRAAQPRIYLVYACDNNTGKLKLQADTQRSLHQTNLSAYTHTAPAGNSHTNTQPPTPHHTTPRTTHQVKGGLLLHVVVGQGELIIELPSAKDEALVARRDPLLSTREGRA